MSILSLFDTLDMQPEEQSEDGGADIHEESCDEKDEDIPGELMPLKIFTLNGLPEIFHNTESAKIKCWKLIQTWKGV